MNQDEAKELIEEYLLRQKEPSLDSIRDPDFPEQDAFVLDPSRYIDAQCSRRAGKTTGLGIRYYRTMHKYPGCFCPYIALTRESAKNIMWNILQELDERYKLRYKFTESNLTATSPTGSRLQLFGADMKNFIKRLKGIKTPGAGIDEAQDFGSHLISLVDDVLTPAISDFLDGWLALTGTVGPIPLGYWYEVTFKKKYGFSHHEWTLFENIYQPNPKGFIQDLKTKRGWDENHPTLLREYYNQWVLDFDSLVLRYQEDVNHYQDIPPASWNYLMGIDLGFVDADAIAILAWSETQSATYLVHEEVVAKQGITELVTQIQALCERYPIAKMVIDEGGLGKKIAEEIRRRHHIPVHPADKTRKFENYAFLNDALRRGHFKARKNSQFVQDTYRLQIDLDKTTPNRIAIKDTFHSDIVDAVLYAFKESPAFSYQPPAPQLKVGTEQWGKQQEKEMFEQAMEQARGEEDFDPKIYF